MSFFFSMRERWWEWDDCWLAINSHARVTIGGEVAIAQGSCKYGERVKERKENGEEEEEKKKKNGKNIGGCG